MNLSVRLLHVEDDVDDQRLLELAVRAHTHRVGIDAFTHAADALDYLRALPPAAYPDLLVVDLNLPGFSGYEFIEALQAAGLNAIPAVVMTTSASAEDEDFCARYGIDMLTKPASVQDWEQLAGWMLATKLSPGVGT